MSAKESSNFFQAYRLGRFLEWHSYLLFSLFLLSGPSVTLEDSGELAVAGDYLGVHTLRDIHLDHVRRYLLAFSVG